MTGQFRKSLLFTNAVGIPCHVETLPERSLVSALVLELCEPLGRTTACWLAAGLYSLHPVELSGILALRKYDWQCLTSPQRGKVASRMKIVFAWSITLFIS